jgi:4-amino-4-deoxy-L-arabinose transferase-like glycosyltransferase
MQSTFLMLSSVAITAICWGIYGPILHWGQADMGAGRLRTFICVGIAYFLVAIVVPVIVMSLTGWEMEEKYATTTMGVVWSLIGGALGAVGALGIILAFTYSPYKSTTPLIVMPLVFGLAPVFNTFFTMYFNRSKGLESISPFFAAGLILTAVGAATVLVFAPRVAAKGDPHAKKAVVKPAIDEVASERAAEIMHATNPNQVMMNEMELEAKAEAAEEGAESKS